MSKGIILTDGETIKLSEVLSALSFMLDMVEGQPEGHVIRSCFIGMILAERLDLSEEQRSALFYALLLKDAGCSSNASKMAALFDADDHEVKRTIKTVNWTSLPHAALHAIRTVSPGKSIWARSMSFMSISLKSQKAPRELIRIRCERGAEITRLMGFPEGTAQAIRGLDEHWDGAGQPDGLRGEEIPLLSRICGLAQTVEVFYTTFGSSRAEKIARSRRGKWFDPELVDVFLSEARTGRIWESLANPDLESNISCMEPSDKVLMATPERLDLTARAFAQIIDAKSPFTYEHSQGVAEVAMKMTEHMGFPVPVVHDQMRAGLLHDIGKLGISNTILDKPGRLTDAEFAKIKAHPRLTYDVLMRVSPFRGIAELAASHHEKLDGTGYHRGVTGEHLSLPARILAVADIFDALSQERPYRPAMPMERVLGILREESGEKLCPESVLALEELVSRGDVGATQRKSPELPAPGFSVNSCS